MQFWSYKVMVFIIASLLFCIDYTGVVYSVNSKRSMATNGKLCARQIFTWMFKNVFQCSHLDVGVAEGPTHGAHGVSNSNVLSVSMTKRHCVGELSLGCGRCCDHGSSVNGIGALGRVHVLPGPPNTVDLAVVEEEPWVTCSWLADEPRMHNKIAVSGILTRRSEKIRSWIAANGKVTSSMDTHEVVGKGWVSTLHVVPEGLDVRAVEQINNLLIVGPLARGPGRNVTLQAARVVSKAHIRVSLVGDGVRRNTVGVAEDGPKVDGPVLERTRRHAASAISLGNLDLRCSIGGNTVKGLVGAAKGTVTTHGSSRTVQSRALAGIVRPPRPVVVWLVALVATLIPQCLLVGPGEVTVPCQEVSRVVDEKRLLDVRGKKVIIAVLTARAFRLWRFRRQLGHALHSLDVVLLLRCRESCPGRTISL